jgi:hypothetical protein
MRGWLAVLVVAGCGGVPDVPARLEDVGTVPQLFQDTPAAFDANDKLVLMDGNSGLRRLEGNRLDVVSGTQQFSFGTMGVDRDGTLLLGSFNTLQLVRLEAGDRIVPVTPAPPTTFTRPIGTPSGAYHIVVGGVQNTLVLPAGGATWEDSMRRLDRTLRAPDGTIYAILDGDIVRLAADDSPVLVASCAELAGGLCFDLELGGTDADGHVHMGVKTQQAVHILDPASGTYRQVTLPGMMRIETLVAGAAMTLVLANDPERDNQRSLWMLAPGSEQLLRFATLLSSGGGFGEFVKLLADRAGNTYVIAEGKLKAVVPN